MNKTRYYIVTVALLIAGTQMSAQDRSTKKADKHYDRLEYVKAIEDYQDLVDDGDGNAYVYKRLADSYYNLYNTKAAGRYYGMYLEADPSADAEYYYRYAQMLKANGDFDKSNQAMQELADKHPGDSRAQAFLADPGYLSELSNEKPRFTVEKLGINTDVIDYGGYENAGKLYFVSMRNTSRRNYGWNGQPTSDVYVSKMDGESYGEPELLKGDVNSKFNEGTVSISEDGGTMYFTRNDYLDGDYEKDSEGINQLKIFSAKNINGKWDDIQSLPFNSSEYSTAHTALSPDGKTLYFSSDMPGGMGLSDLYKVAVSEDGSFGEPQNLGDNINTAGKESFPFIDKDGTLYFSSNGQLGMGGLDVFYAKAKGNGFAKPINIGQPINSQGDDFAFAYNNADKAGYVSSNRGGMAENTASDNIYRVKEIQAKELEVNSQIVNSETGKPIGEATVKVMDDKQNQVASGTTNPEGRYDFTLPAGKQYSLQVEAKDYEPGAKLIGKEKEGQLTLTIELDPVEKMIQEEEIVLNPIMFDFDKSAIRSQAAFELDKLVAIMKKHPDMEIAVESHTDQSGAANYNQKLSERRAKSTVEYVTSKGIDPSRISGKGFGEKNPKIDCGSDCSEQQSELNRRSEFRIVK